jgi:hypothetical protein
MHGVESCLIKLTDVNSQAYARIFAGVRPDERESPSNSSSGGGGLTPAREVLRRIRWDETLPSSSFTVLHYDRVTDKLVETPFDAPNSSISSSETLFVFALPEHRIEKVKYLDRVVWDKALRIDFVYGSMNGNGMTIDRIIDAFSDWKRERDERIEMDQQRQIEVLEEMSLILGETRLGVLKELSSQLIRCEWDTDGVLDYVKRVGSLYYKAMRENQIDDADDASQGEEDGTDIIDFLHLFSDLAALLSDKFLREAILSEVESVMEQYHGALASRLSQTGRSTPPELNEEDPVEGRCLP